MADENRGELLNLRLDGGITENPARLDVWAQALRAAAGTGDSERSQEVLAERLAAGGEELPPVQLGRYAEQVAGADPDRLTISGDDNVVAFTTDPQQQVGSPWVEPDPGRDTEDPEHPDRPVYS